MNHDDEYIIKAPLLSQGAINPAQLSPAQSSETSRKIESSFHRIVSNPPSRRNFTRPDRSVDDGGELVIIAPAPDDRMEVQIASCDGFMDHPSAPNDEQRAGCMTSEEALADSFAEMLEPPSNTEPAYVVIDGANVGWAHGNGTMFSGSGIKVAVDFFQLTYGSRVSVKAFLPSSYYRRRVKGAARGNAIMETEDWAVLDELVHSGILSVVPAGDNDDEYILTFARNHNGFVVSNDFFVDHIGKMKERSIRASFELFVAARRCSYTFTSKNEFMPNPQRYFAESPLGIS
jgi:hypothetical protein